MIGRYRGFICYLRCFHKGKGTPFLLSAHIPFEDGHRQDLTEISLVVTSVQDPKRRRRPAIAAVLLFWDGSSNHYVATSNNVCVSSLCAEALYQMASRNNSYICW
ncbi:hypothetical protein PILCRDRAFT_821289 [Piloderma croceum F 1598]|uniref:Uncharacterized protein n=1 Tax=Piloderma croceum (strain F 1598) TaxID=765440 RepID=A0A0C3FNZ0_PILCF|nr:hypothetical protein PILCRDRAFT_821289 [Piloderma croceum F 1598]